MSNTLDPVLRIECQKILRAPVARVAAIAVLALVSATSIGGYAAALHSPDSDIGSKTAAMITAPGWAGYIGLTALSLGITALLAAGIVTAWIVGREFTDGTIVGLFAIPSSLGAVASAKILACAGWGTVLILTQSIVSALGGIALGLPASGALHGWLTVFATGITIICSALPMAWVATRWRGYLPGIAATLAVLVVSNLAAGFGFGRYIPWAIPVLWAAPDESVSTTALAVPVVIGLVGAWATRHAWAHLELGRR